MPSACGKWIADALGGGVRRVTLDEDWQESDRQTSWVGRSPYSMGAVYRVNSAGLRRLGRPLEDHANIMETWDEG